jgi:hypothetical protein
LYDTWSLSDGADIQTPNFAMDTSDINPTAPPEEERYTTHLFDPAERPSLGKETLPLGSPLRICDDHTQWPPAILFDAVYASAVLHHFMPQTLKDDVTKTWNNIFYRGGAITRAEADLRKIKGQGATTAARQRQQGEERRTRTAARSAQHEAHDGPDTFDMLMVLPFIRVPPNEVQAMLSEAEEEAEAAEQRRVHEKVDSWMKQNTPV